MAIDRAFGWTLVVLFCAASALGCNMITGADGIELVDDDELESSSESAASGAGGATSGSASGPDGSSGVTTNGAGGSAPAMAPVDGVALSDVIVYQSVSRPIVEAGSPVTSNVPIVAGRPALWRVFYTTDGAYNGMAVTARLTFQGAAPLETSLTLGSSSSEGDPASTINFEVPAELMTPGASYRVDLLQPAEQSSGANAAARFPGAEGTMQDLGAQTAGVLKIKLVPIQYNADGSGRLPDTSAGQLQLYEDMFYAIYPIADVDLTVRQAVGWSSQVTAGGSGWQNLLNAIADLRQNDGAPFDQYYYGIFRPTSTFSGYCGGGCVTGLGFIGGPQDGWSHSAIGIGYSGDGSVETAVHELGHNHGREHAPCGTSGDGAYPYSGASIGVWGYDMVNGLLFPPNQYVDMMSYCNPTWISDYNFRHIFERVQFVSGASFYTPPALMNQTYTRVLVHPDGSGSWMSPITLERPPLGESVSVSLQTRAGTLQKTGAFVRYDHLQGGVLFVPPAGQGGQTVQALSAVIDGMPLSMARQP